MAAMQLNFDGTRLATASDKGTLIRIYDTDSGQQLQEVRRGADRADIYCLAFNVNSTWLAATSDKGTVHVWALAGAAKGANANNTAREDVLAGYPVRDVH